jgi:hypothetical protein
MTSIISRLFNEKKALSVCANCEAGHDHHETEKYTDEAGLTLDIIPAWEWMLTQQEAQ